MNIKTLIIRSPFLKLAIKLNLTDFLMDLYWKRGNKSKWSAIEATGHIDAPASVWFEPTIRCNLTCQFCHQTDRRKKKSTELTTEEVYSFFENVKQMQIPRIDMIGGEIFVRKDMFELIEWIDNNDMKVKLGSNGVLIDDIRAERLKKFKCIESIAISLDGKKETHDWLRGKKGAFEKSTNAIQMLSGGDFMIASYGVIVPENFDSIEYLITHSKKIGIDRMCFIPEMSYSKKDIEQTKKLLKLDDSSPIYVEEKEIEDTNEYYEIMNRSMLEIKKQRRKHTTFSPVYPNYSLQYPKKFFTNKSRNHKLICKHLEILTVKENGDVVVCPYIQIKAGNVKEQPIEEIWNNEILMSARKSILSKNLLPVCARCCAIERCG